MNEKLHPSSWEQISPPRIIYVTHATLSDLAEFFCIGSGTQKATIYVRDG